MKPPCCDNSSMKRGLWSKDEDSKILEYVSKHGTSKWASGSKKAGLGRSGKSSKLRRTNNNSNNNNNNNCVRSDHKTEDLTPKEEDLIIKLHAAIGSRWSMIAQQLQGRTDNDVKSYWNTKLKKKLTDMGIDPVTHKPFSQIFASYGSVAGLSKPGSTRIGSFNKDLRNAMVTPSPTMPMSMMPSQVMVSLDLLAELQAINMVKDPATTNYNNPVFIVANEPSSSSSSTCSSAAQDLCHAVPFNWNEFLLEDEFLPECTQEQNNETIFGEVANKEVGHHTHYSSNDEASESSFVEALLAKESEMLMEFPDLMGDGFY